HEDAMAARFTPDLMAPGLHHGNQPLLSAHEETRFAKTRPGLLVCRSEVRPGGQVGCIVEDVGRVTSADSALTIAARHRLLRFDSFFVAWRPGRPSRRG